MKVLMFVLIAVAGLLVITIAKFFSLWLRAMVSGAPVSMIKLIIMRLRGVPASTIVNTRIMAVKAGLDIASDELEAHYLASDGQPIMGKPASGTYHVESVVKALISASKAEIALDFKKAAAIDLAGRNVLEAVQTSVMPKVIDCPDPAKGASTIAAVAMDGIQLKAKARVTVKTNIQQLVGGATEETIIARVGEGIVTTIGSAETYKKVLENPDMISKKVLERGLDAGTAFEILSIDIADVDVGDNIGAKLQAKQADADKQIAQAKAESRRAMAVATEQEMKAKVVDMRSKVIEAEAEVPKAMADAFRKGNLGIMDYYKMKNIQSDTGMRDSIADGTKETKSKKE